MHSVALEKAFLMMCLDLSFVLVKILSFCTVYGNCSGESIANKAVYIKIKD